MEDRAIAEILTTDQTETSRLNAMFEETRQVVPDEPWHEAESIYVSVPDGRIRVLHTQPDGSGSRRPIVFVPGWGTVPAGFAATFEVLYRRADWYYVETREKGSSDLNKKRARLDMDAMAEDVARAIEQADLDDFVLVGTCWGSAVILHGIHRGIVDAPTVVVSDPMHELWAASWIRRFLIPLAPVPVIDLLRAPLTRIALRNMSEGPQRRRAESFIENAVLWKWKRAARQCLNFDLYGFVHQIDREIFVTNGASDIIHDNLNYPRISALLPRGRFLYLQTDEENRERLLGVLSKEFAAVSAADGLPESLARFERDVSHLR